MIGDSSKEGQGEKAQGERSLSQLYQDADRPGVGTQETLPPKQQDQSTESELEPHFRRKRARNNVNNRSNRVKKPRAYSAGTQVSPARPRRGTSRLNAPTTETLQSQPANKSLWIRPHNDMSDAKPVATYYDSSCKSSLISKNAALRLGLQTYPCPPALHLAILTDFGMFEPEEFVALDVEAPWLRDSHFGECYATIVSGSVLESKGIEFLAGKRLLDKLRINDSLSQGTQAQIDSGFGRGEHRPKTVLSLANGSGLVGFENSKAYDALNHLHPDEGTRSQSSSTSASREPSLLSTRSGAPDSTNLTSFPETQPFLNEHTKPSLSQVFYEDDHTRFEGIIDGDQSDSYNFIEGVNNLSLAPVFGQAPIQNTGRLEVPQLTAASPSVSHDGLVFHNSYAGTLPPQIRDTQMDSSGYSFLSQIPQSLYSFAAVLSSKNNAESTANFPEPQQDTTRWTSSTSTSQYLSTEPERSPIFPTILPETHVDPPGSDTTQRETRIKDTLADISKPLDRIGPPTNDPTPAVRTMYIDEVKNWLSPPDTSTNSNHGRLERQNGLGTWFLKSTAFNEWKTGTRQHVWLHGIFGSGKTVLSTAILDHVSQIHDHIALGYFFDFSDISKHRIDAMYRSLAFQLYMQRQAPRKILEELFASHDDGRKQAETEKLSECFHAMLQVSGKVFIVLDALDECDSTTELLEWIQGVVSSPHLHNVQLLATSRPGEELRRGIRKYIGEQNCISFDMNFLNEDPGAYISSRLEQSQTFKGWLNPELLEKIRCEVERNAGGMLRLAACQLDDLEQSTSLDDLSSRLNDLPRNLSAMYDRMIMNIPPEIKSDALCLLGLLVHAERPVTCAEAVDHTSTQAENGQVDVQRRRLVDEDIMSFCPGLISITEESREGKLTRVIQLAHITVREYLMCRSEFQLPPATIRVAFTESYGSSSVASQIFSDEAVSTKPSSLEEDINVTEDHATRQMAKTFYSHKQTESSCSDINDDIRSLASGPEDIQSQDGSNSARWEVREAAANYLADMLAHDPKLSPLYDDAFKGLDDSRFLRNHRRLLRRYYISLLSQAPSQKQGTAVDFLRPRSHRILISRKILDNTRREIVPVTLPQENERNLILERFLNKVDDRSDIQTPLDIDGGDESESSVDGDEEDEDDHDAFAFVDLEDARSYFVSGIPLIQFEAEFREFLHPSRQGVEVMQEETQNQTQKETNQGVVPEPREWSYSIIRLKNRPSSWLCDTCYPPKSGYRRLWYICDCGDHMFVDVKELSPGGIHRFRQRFAKDGLARLLTPSDPMTNQDTTVGDDSRGGISAPPPAHLRSGRDQSTSSSQNSGSSSSQSRQGPSAPINDASGSEKVALPPGQQETPQYLLLCVNQKSLPVLDHIDCSSFRNDQYLFQQISGRYRTIRDGSAWRIPLLFPAFVCALVGKATAFLKQKTPSWLEWMFQFFRKLSEASLFEMHTGEYVKFQLVPMGDETTKPHHFRCGEYPPEFEVQGKRYLYDPVPTDVAVDAIPLWHLTKPGVRHSDNYWITTFPKKLRGPLRRERGTNVRIIGWGIRINERFNWHLFFSFLLVVLVVIWAIVAIYLACKADDSSGFGLGALLAAFAAVYVPLQYQAWKEKLD